MSLARPLEADRDSCLINEKVGRTTEPEGCLALYLFSTLMMPAECERVFSSVKTLITGPQE